MSVAVTGALFALIGFVVFAARRLLTYLHIFQQEEYDGPRFLRWLVHSGAFDRRLSLAIIVVSAAQLIAAKYVPDWLFPALIGTVCLGAAAIRNSPCTASGCRAAGCNPTRLPKECPIQILRPAAKVESHSAVASA